MTDESKQDYLDMITDCENRESKLTEWEGEFFESVSEQLYERGSLSQRQAETLERIWEKCTKEG